ncbi:sensor histidine kinase [Halospeciosus flavus]|uniref:sensor histidine kinase n=1 Tax=Halospeciosus flavus TaxID=3032283 RepID=UPI00361EDF4C
MFVNVFENAVEHGTESEGRPAVTVDVGVTPTGFYVADDGSGLSAEERENLFDAGYTTASRGTGFGLAIVQRIADGHGWDVDVDESAAGGARFDVTGVEFTD